MIALLEKLGLSEKEARVYLASLELGENSVQNIAKKSGVNRVTTYVILEKLLEMSLISKYDKDKKTFYVAQDPQELAHLIQTERQTIDERQKVLDANIGHLEAIFNQNRTNQPYIRYFEGAKGLLELDRYGRNLIRPNEEFLSITPIDLIEEYFPQKRKESLQERVKLGIKNRTIYTHRNGEIDKFKNKKELRDGVFIPRDKFPIDATITIYPNWGIKMYYFNKNHPYGVMLESKELAENMRLFFELAWFGAKHINKK